MAEFWVRLCLQEDFFYENWNANTCLTVT